MMKGSLTVAVATGALVVVAYGGFAMAAEAENPGDAVAAITATAEPEQSSGEEASGDVSSPDAPVDDNGLVCVLVPIATDAAEETAPAEESDSAEGEPTAVEPVTIEQLLEVNEIECSGTGNERSSEVALVPRYLAHSDEFTGAEKGAAISAWAKTHANQNSDADEDAAEAPEDVVEPSSPAAPGRSGDAPGHSGSHPGNGRGH